MLLDETSECNVVTARLTSGPDEGSAANLEHPIESKTRASTLEAGDDIVLNDGGPDVPDDARYSFADVQRTAPLAILAVAFGAAVVALGRMRGVLALLGILLTVGVLPVYLFPALLRGSSPVGARAGNGRRPHDRDPGGGDRPDAGRLDRAGGIGAPHDDAGGLDRQPVGATPPRGAACHGRTPGHGRE